MPRLPTITCSPTFVARISLLREMVNRGDKMASSSNQLKRGDVGKSPWGTCEGRARSALYAELDAKRKAKKRKKRNKKNLSLGISLAMSAECRPANSRGGARLVSGGLPTLGKRR